MEEHVWSLVELFLSGKATNAELDELAYLLGTHARLFNAVKEFLDDYQDTDPEVTSLQKQELLNHAERYQQRFPHRLSRGKSATIRAAG